MHPFINRCHFQSLTNESINIEFDLAPPAPASSTQIILRNAIDYALHAQILQDKQQLKDCSYNVWSLHDMIQNPEIPPRIPGPEYVLNIRALVDELRHHQSPPLQETDTHRSHQDPLPLPPSELSRDTPTTPGSTFPQVSSNGDIFKLQFDRNEEGMPSSRSEPTLDIVHSPSSDSTPHFLLFSLQHIQCEDRISTMKPHIFALIPLDREAVEVVVHFTICDPVVGVVNHHQYRHDSDRGDWSDTQSDQHSGSRTEIVESDSIESLPFQSNINESTDRTPTGLLIVIGMISCTVSFPIKSTR